VHGGVAMIAILRRLWDAFTAPDDDDVPDWWFQ